MLRDAGCTHVIIGHSERRQLFGETDATVNARLRAALRAGLVPIVCVGETLARARGRRDAGGHRRARSAAALAGIDRGDHRRRACSPTSRCGRSAPGKTATPGAGAGGPPRHPRACSPSSSAPPVADAVRILYGGSVKPDNIDALMAEPDIDGALVGGASLDAAAFARIVKFQESR